MDKVASHTFGPLWVEGSWLQVLAWEQGPIFMLDNCPAGNWVSSCYHVSLEGPRGRKCVQEASLLVSTEGDHPRQVTNTQLHNLLPRESNTSNKQYSTERAKTKSKILVSLEWAGSGGTGEPGEAQGSSHTTEWEKAHPPMFPTLLFQSWPRRRLILLLGNLGFSCPHPVKGGVN